MEHISAAFWSYKKDLWSNSPDIICPKSISRSWVVIKKKKKTPKSESKFQAQVFYSNQTLTALWFTFIFMVCGTLLAALVKLGSAFPLQNAAFRALELSCKKIDWEFGMAPWPEWKILFVGNTWLPICIKCLGSYFGLRVAVKSHWRSRNLNPFCI